MFIVHVDILVKQKMARALEPMFKDVFTPAISIQPGFSQTKLLRAKSGESLSYRLVIVFETQELQKQWVATELHQQVWTKMEAMFAQYSVDDFETV